MPINHLFSRGMLKTCRNNYKPEINSTEMQVFFSVCILCQNSGQVLM